jgi:murein DD-endopeptidase MepM/ murein hydrolase activator NlpD
MPNPSDSVDFVGPDLNPANAPADATAHAATVTGGASVTGGTPVTHVNPTQPQQPAALPTGADPIFPLLKPPLANWATGGRSFGSPRPGRLHAACDCLGNWGDPIRAIADGEVHRGPVFFYQGTNELEIWHPGIGLARYGEISSSSKWVVPLKAGDKVHKGQIIAHVGRNDISGFSMLHFEFYTGKASGPLTVVSNAPYERRSDLENPTSFLTKLLKSTFPSFHF